MQLIQSHKYASQSLGRSALRQQSLALPTSCGQPCGPRTRRCPPLRVADTGLGSTSNNVQEEQVPQQLSPLALKAQLRRQQRAREQLVYQFSAIAATSGIAALTVASVWYKFYFHVPEGAPFPWVDMLGTLALVGGGAVGMEAWARWAHRALWHDFQPGWSLHKSHHEPRVGPFEANDIYAICNAVPAISLCAYGFFTPTLVGSLCFGAGLGITVFGMGYMFIHDGLVHKRFPVGPIAELPYMKRVVVAHRLHHSEKYGGVPWGMFLGPQELEALGAGPELDRLVEELGTAPSRR